MYIQSEKLQARIREISREAARQSGGVIAFEEFVAVPYYGQIVLRYMLNIDSFTLEDLDRYENLLNENAGGDFLCDFMGSVYQKAGVDYSGIWQRLAEMNDRFADEEIIPSIHADGIREDAVFLLKAAGLDPDSPVWEIQAEGNEFTLILLGKENRQIRSITEPVRLTVEETDNRVCSGLMKGTFHCRRNHISLARILGAE